MVTKPLANGFLSKPVVRIAIIAGCILLFFYTENHFRFLNNQGWVTLKFPAIDMRIDGFAIDSKGNFWLGGGNTCGEITIISPDKTWKSYIPGNSPVEKFDCVSELAIDGNDQVWIGTQSGLSMLESSGNWITYDKDDWYLLDHHVHAIAVDIDGSVYVISTDSSIQAQLSVLKPDGKWMAVSSMSGFDFINAIAIDPQGRIWLGASQRNGLAVLGLYGKWTRYYYSPSGLASSSVQDVLIDSQGYVWASTKGAGLSVLAPNGTWTTYTSLNSGLKSDWIDELALDSLGQIWVGYQSDRSGLIFQTFDPQNITPPIVLSAFVPVRALSFWLLIVVTVPLAFTFVRKPEMFPVNKLAATQGARNWFFLWVIWGISTITGWVIVSAGNSSGYSDSDIYVYSLLTAFSLLGGGIAGIGQWYVLKLLGIDKAYLWVRTSFFAWFFASPVLLVMLGTRMDLNFGPWTGILTNAICALTVGIAQWTLLRRWVHNAEWWIFATALGWPWPFNQALERAIGEPLLSWPLQIGIWSLYGVISATTFLYLFRRKMK